MQKEEKFHSFFFTNKVFAQYLLEVGVVWQENQTDVCWSQKALIKYWEIEINDWKLLQTLFYWVDNNFLYFYNLLDEIFEFYENVWRNNMKEDKI